MILAGNISDITEEIPDIDPQETVVKVNRFVEWCTSRIPVFINGLIMIAVAIAIFIIGRKLINFIVNLIEKSFRKSNIDEGVIKFLKSFIRIALLIFLLVMIAGFLGIETTSLAAIIGSAGLAIGLSLQGSLANFAGGVLILVLKPFKVGDYIICNGFEGTVHGMDIFYTRMLTIDNKLVVIPNGTLSNSTITNVTNEPVRRVDILVGIEYSQNIGLVKDILLKVANSNELVDKEKDITVYVDSFEASAVMIGLRAWTKTEDYWTVRWGLLESIKEEFDNEGISIPFNQLDVCIKK